MSCFAAIESGGQDVCIIEAHLRLECELLARPDLVYVVDGCGGFIYSAVGLTITAPWLLIERNIRKVLRLSSDQRSRHILCGGHPTWSSCC